MAGSVEPFRLLEFTMASSGTKPVRLQGINVARLAAGTAAPVFINASKPKASATPATSVVARSALTPRIQDVKVIEPTMAMRISAIPFLVRTGVERSKLSAPVAPSSAVTDTTVFQDAKDASIEYFVMGYRLYEENTTRGKQFAVRMLARDQHWELTAEIVEAPPDVVVRAHPRAKALPKEEVSLLLRYKQRVNGVPSAVVEARFTEMEIEHDHVRGTLVIDSLAKRDEVYRALSDPDLACTLIVRRKARIALPVPPQRTAPGSERPAAPATLRITPMVATGMIGHVPIRRIPVPNTPRPRPRPRPTPTPPPQLYRETDRVFDLELPFTFDPTLHAYVFEGVGVVPSGASQGLVRRQVEWNGQPYVYYQDDGVRNLFYYLPDTFKIARRPDAPHEPILSVRFDSEDGSREKMQATCTYCAVPVVSRKRLISTLPALRAHVHADILEAAGGVELEPLLPDPSKIEFRLAYPGSDSHAGPFAARPGAAVDLRAGIVDSLTVSLDEFRALYDAMFSAGQLLFTGSVRFDLGGRGEEVPVRLRFTDTAEPLASWSTAAGADHLGIDLTNEIESPLQVHAMAAVLHDDADLVVEPAEPGTGAYPVTVAPAAAARFDIAGAQALTLEDLDLSQVEALPDKEALYDLVLDPSTTASFLRAIKVKTFAPMFTAPAGKPEDQVMSIVVDFEDGTTVELTSDHLEASVNVPVPLAGFVLGMEGQQTYRYKVTIVRLSGATGDADWQTGESGMLFPSIT